MNCLLVTAFAALVLSAGAALAGPREDVVDALVKCADITDKAERLACYDNAAPQLRAAAQAPALPPAQAAQTSEPLPPQTPASQAPASQEEGSFFSALDPFGGGPQGPTAQQMTYQPLGAEILPVTIGIADFTVEPSGSFSVTLDNGQVWRERNEHYDHPQFRADAKNVVVIERGLIGGYNLYLRGEGKPYKVLRVK